MLYLKNNQLKRINYLLVFVLLFNIFITPVFSMDCLSSKVEKIKNEGLEAISAFYDSRNLDDYYGIELEKIFFSFVNEKNKKEPLPIEKLMDEAREIIKENKEELSEQKIQEKCVGLILIKVFTPLIKKLEKIERNSGIDYKKFEERVKLPAKHSEALKALGYASGGVLVSSAILAAVVVIKINTMALTTWVCATVAAWWAGTTLVATTTTSTILGPWGMAVVITVGGITTYLYIRSKLKEAERSRIDAYNELKTVIGNTEAEIKNQWLQMMNDLK